MVPRNHRILTPLPPAAETPLRRIAPPFIVQTAPLPSTICAAGGTVVPSADAVPEGGGSEGGVVAVPPGCVGPTLAQPAPSHFHQLPPLDPST